MRSVSGYRLALGLLQGAALSLLYFAYDQQLWPATDGGVFAPLLMAALFVPLIVIQSLRLLRLRTLIAWTIVATALIAALSFYDVWRAWPEDWVFASTPPFGGAWQPHVLPSWPLILALAAMLFIAHALVVSADADGRLLAQYATYFDVAWEQGVQLALSAIFVGVFWALMWLGAGLFELLSIDFLTRLFRHHWFWIPATTLAIALAIQVTDTRVGLVRGTRVLALTLLSLLLPLLTLLVIGFLAALGVKGLEPLWSTRHGSAALLFATAVILVLINATYQDGARDRSVSALLRWAATVAAILPAPLVALAGYALALRIEQYGWTGERVIAAAIVVVAACYAAGYLWAAVARPWLHAIERWNVYCALATLLALLALFSPIADPARISVDDQMARVARGAIPPDKLDLHYLRWDAGRYGKAALETIVAGEHGKTQSLRDAASRLLTARDRYTQTPVANAAAANIAVHPADDPLAKSFLAQDWGKTNDIDVPSCLRVDVAPPCALFVKDLKGDGSPQIVIVQGASVTAFDRDADGTWRFSGRWLASCPAATQALHDGDFAAATSAPPPWPDLEVAGQRLRFAPKTAPPVCPPPGNG